MASFRKKCQIYINLSSYIFAFCLLHFFIMSQEIFELIYDPKSFPLLFYDSKSQDPITEDNLSLNDHIILGIYNSNEKFDINFERYNITLTNILSDQNDLLKIRAILLIIMIKNSINIMPIFENLLTEDIINNQQGVEYSDDLFNSYHRYFNDIFFNELCKHYYLMINFIEIVKSFIGKVSHSARLKVNDIIYPIINSFFLANEKSLTPVEEDKLIFMDESDLSDDDRKYIDKYFTIVLPFKLKYNEYNKYSPSKTTLNISVNRNNVLAAVWPLADISNYDCNIRVNFGEGESDAGGPGREFFNIAFKEIIKPETDLFELRNKYYWFKSHKTMTEDLKKKYKSVGILLGIAVLNHMTIPFRFPKVFYKKLLRKDIDISDLHTLDPDLFERFCDLSKTNVNQYNIEFVYNDSITGYEIDLTNFSYVESDEYNPTPVTDENKNEFKIKYLQWLLDISVKEAFEALEEGYKKISSSPMLYDRFTLAEFDRIVSGYHIFDWDSLKENARYYGNYTKDSQVIKWFWQFFDSLSEDKKFEALQFITGTTSVPVGGLKDIKISFNTITSPYPKAHTCSSAIDLPEYSSYNELEKGCSEAFPNIYYGFG